MQEQDKLRYEREFEKGKRYLDSGRYQEALQVYDNLINEVSKEMGDEYADLLLETSYNNRGMAKCKIALYRKDKDLYKQGMSDFQQSIDMDKHVKEIELTWLTAYKNLQFAETEIKRIETENNQEDPPVGFFSS